MQSVQPCIVRACGLARSVLGCSVCCCAVRSRPKLWVYHTAPALPVLWASGFRLGGPSSVVVASRPTSMAYYATVPDVLCSLVSRAQCYPGDWPAPPPPANQPAFCASRFATHSAGQRVGSHCAQLIELLLQLITCLYVCIMFCF